MDIVNLNKSIDKELENSPNNRSTFNLNLNPFSIDERSKEKIDNKSLDYLKIIAKKPNIKLRSLESDDYDFNKNSKMKLQSSIITNENINEEKKSNHNVRVSFKENLVETEVKKGNIFLNIIL
jgi:hypothetical protein